MYAEYDCISTERDIYNERFLQGAELVGKFGFPALMGLDVKPTKTISFSKSFKCKDDIEHTNVNFYENDYVFLRIWNDIVRYTDYLSKFESVCMPDFSVSLFAPLAVNVWSVYKNRVLAYWYQQNGLDVIPSVNILPKEYQDWIYDGLPQYSTLCCGTNGRTKTEELRLEFCEWFYEMEKRLKPIRVIIYGRRIEELKANCEIVYLETDNMRVNNGRRKENKVVQVAQ